MTNSTGNYEGSAAIFDLDDTLIDSKSKLNQDVIGTMQRLGVSIGPEDIGSDWYAMVSNYGKTAADFDREFKNRKTWKASLEDGEVKIFPDTHEVLAELKNRGMKLALLSKSYEDLTSQKLEHFDLRKYFQRVACVSPRKDSLKKYGAIYAVNELDPASLRKGFVYCIGDKLEDITFDEDITREFDIPSTGILVARNGQPSPPYGSRFHRARVSNLREIQAIVEKGGDIA